MQKREEGVGKKLRALRAGGGIKKRDKARHIDRFATVRGETEKQIGVREKRVHHSLTKSTACMQNRRGKRKEQREKP